MKFTRLHLGIVLTTAALLGIYWAVSAQDHAPVFPPPTIPLPEPASKSKKKPAPADPTLIIPPEVYEVPRPIGPGEVTTVVPLEKPDVVPTGGQLPSPMFPPAPVVAIPALPPPVPTIETKPPIVPNLPAPLPEPTKVLLFDPPTREAPQPGEELPLPPPVVPPLGSMDSMKPGTAESPIVPSLPALERVKSFVRIRQGDNAAAPVAMTPVPVAPFSPPIQAGRLIEPPPLPGPSRDALVNLQTPAIAVEKRGPTFLRARETQLYHLVIRNQSAIPAQQVRIEDEIPADVRILTADPPPQMQGNRATWTLPVLAPGSEQSLRLTLKADANVQLACNTSVHVSAGSTATTATMTTTTTRVNSAPGALSVRLSGPEHVAVGQPAVFDIHVTNSTGQPLTGLILYGELPAGLAAQVSDEYGRAREERQIEAKIDGVAIAPGDFKILKMPTTAVKPGRYTIQARVATNAGEASATANIEVVGETRFLQQPPATRLVPGRNGDLRIELANNTAKPMRNVMVADLLPEGLVFIDVSDGGLFQANTRTVHWLVDQMPVGATKTLVVRVNGVKTGQCQNIVSARADGVAEMRSAGLLVLEGFSDLALRVIDQNNPVEVGRETVYEIQVHNPGSAPASTVRLQVQFPPGLIPKNAQSNGRFSIQRNTVVFEPIASLAPQGQAIFRVSALAQTAGKDQRVRFSVVSDETIRPRTREIGVMVTERN